MMSHLLHATLQKVHPFPDDVFQQFLTLFEERSLAKNEILFRQGSVVKSLCFIMSGCMRQYHIPADSNERNIFFAEEGWWCGEMESFIERVPSSMNMQAIEDCRVLCIGRDDWENATKAFPDYAMYQIKNRGRTVAWLKTLLSNMATETPDEKYRRILKETPHWLNRIPQYHIASYLGVTPETLSRIRKRNVHL